jgi:LPPG:FO 2-phospho-L-lactate transferase
MVVVLSGGAGGGRFASGLLRAVPPETVTVVCNTADDIDVYGVRVCPDLDLVMFTIAGVLDRSRGYGLEADTRTVMEELRAHGIDTWFDLGDRDFALCVARTRALERGEALHRITASIAHRFGLACRILPMCDEPVWTAIASDAGTMHFQDYWVRYRAEISVHGVGFTGIDAARPAPGVLEAVAAADVILLAPSNPVVSIGPILAVPGMRDALVRAAAPVIAVTPIVGGAVLRGMADRLLRALDVEVSASGVASMYAGLADGFVLDVVDEALASRIESLGMRVAICDTIMRDDDATASIARTALALADRVRV